MRVSAVFGFGVLLYLQQGCTAVDYSRNSHQRISFYLKPKVTDTSVI